MAKLIITILILFISVGLASAHGINLWQHFEGDLPSLKVRSAMYFDLVGDEEYKGTKEQNIVLLQSLHGSFVLGSLAPLPGPTAEGTTTAGWTDDGSIVRLNTAADNVGIGTSNPSTKLQVAGAGYFTGNLSVAGGSLNLSEGTATTTITLASNGRIGVGTTTPSAKLSIGGNLMANGTTTLGTLVLASSTIQINGTNYILPTTDGTNGQALTTDGNRVLSFSTTVVADALSLTAHGTTTTGTLFATTSLKVVGNQFQIATTTLSTNGGMATTSEIVFDGMGGVSMGIPFSTGATSTNPGNTQAMVIAHGLGRIPRLIKVTLISTIDIGANPEFAQSFGTATSTNINSQRTISSTYQAADVSATVLNTLVAGEIAALRDSGAAYDYEATITDMNATTFSITATTNTTAGDNAIRIFLWEVQ